MFPTRESSAMRLKMTKTGKSTRLYAIKSTYDPDTKKTSSKVVAKLGTAEDIMQREHLTYEEAINWARERVQEMTEDAAAESSALQIRLRPNHRIKAGDRRVKNIGSVFIARAFRELGIESLCKEAVESVSPNSNIGETVMSLIAGELLFNAYVTRNLSSKMIGVQELGPKQAEETLELLGACSEGLIEGCLSLRGRVVPIRGLYRSIALLRGMSDEQGMSIEQGMSEGQADLFKLEQERLAWNEFSVTEEPSPLRDKITKGSLVCRFLGAQIIEHIVQRTEGQFTRECLLCTMRGMNMLELVGEGFIPLYTRDVVTDALHKAFGFRTDCEIVKSSHLRKIMS